MVGNAVGLSVGYGVANDGVVVGVGVGSTAETPPTASDPSVVTSPPLIALTCGVEECGPLWRLCVPLRR